MKFSIRDLLWLTLVAGSLTGWWLDHRRLERIDHENATLRIDNLAKSQALEIAANSAKQANSLRREVEFLAQLVRRRDAELQQRNAELSDSLAKREAVIDAIRAAKDATLPSN